MTFGSPPGDRFNVHRWTGTRAFDGKPYRSDTADALLTGVRR